jgi:hypothetical protein
LYNEFLYNDGPLPWVFIELVAPQERRGRRRGKKEKR